MPLISGGGGGATFNGGTITRALIVDTRPDNVTLPFRVRAGDPATTGIDFRVDPSAPRIYYQGIDSFAQLRLYDDFSSNVLDVSNGGVTATGGNIGRQDTDFTNAIQLRADGLLIAVHAAPADGDLNVGECVLWFDQTDGVGNTKLMVKGKSADGTVKTGSLALA